VITKHRTNDWIVYYNRGIAYTEKEQYELAKNDFGKSIANKADNYEAYYRRAEVYQKMGKASFAIKDYNKVMQLNPKDPLPYFERGKHHWNNKEVGACITDMTQYIKLTKTPKPEAYYLRGASYFLLNEKDKGCEDLVKAKEMGMKGAAEMHKKACFDVK
jgi:tetratricopeptide (TPR) repeat protein